jgi:hypothetical protein
MSDPLIERLAALALDLVLDPPSGDDPVVRVAPWPPCMPFSWPGAASNPIW